jgi:hypothetical protein
MVHMLWIFSEVNQLLDFWILTSMEIMTIPFEVLFCTLPLKLVIVLPFAI